MIDKPPTYTHDGCEYDNLEDYIQCGILGNCGCGYPRVSLEFLRKVLNLINTYRESGTIDDFDKLSQLFHNDDGIQYTIYYMLDKYKLIDHGSSVPGWLSDTGKELLGHLNKLSEEGE